MCFFALTVTARASVPTLNSIGFLPIDLPCSISFCFYWSRSVCDITLASYCETFKPAPLPILSTVIVPLYPSSVNLSAILSERGNTVEDPAVTIFPLTLSGLTQGVRLLFLIQSTQMHLVL